MIKPHPLHSPAPSLPHRSFSHRGYRCCRSVVYNPEWQCEREDCRDRNPSYNLALKSPDSLEESNSPRFCSPADEREESSACPGPAILSNTHHKYLHFNVIQYLYSWTHVWLKHEYQLLVILTSLAPFNFLFSFGRRLRHEIQATEVKHFLLPSRSFSKVSAAIHSVAGPDPFKVEAETLNV